MHRPSIVQVDQGLEIPVIDLQAYVEGEPHALEETANAVAQASEGLGFYFLKHHGVEDRLILRMF